MSDGKTLTEMFEPIFALRAKVDSAKRIFDILNDGFEAQCQRRADALDAYVRAERDYDDALRSLKEKLREN